MNSRNGEPARREPQPLNALFKGKGNNGGKCGIGKGSKGGGKGKGKERQRIPCAPPIRTAQIVILEFELINFSLI